MMNHRPTSKCTVVDTFPSFLELWGRVQGQSLEAGIETWLAQFHAEWPVLAAKLDNSYVEDGLQWRQVLGERVFPFLRQRLPLMTEAHDHLVNCTEPTYLQAQQAIPALDFDVCFVILAIGYGGWATSYQGTPACLLGLDTIVECGWTSPGALTGLVSHELGHLLHSHLRTGCQLADGTGPFWNLYTEGFAQRCEHLFGGSDSWHMQHGQDGWLSWCIEQRSWLATECLKTVAAGEPLHNFFGSWPEYNISGRHQCGYFLG